MPFEWHKTVGIVAWIFNYILTERKFINNHYSIDLPEQPLNICQESFFHFLLNTLFNSLTHSLFKYIFYVFQTLIKKMKWKSSEQTKSFPIWFSIVPSYNIKKKFKYLSNKTSKTLFKYQIRIKINDVYSQCCDVHFM